MNKLVAHPDLWRLLMSVPEGQEWVANIEKSSSPAELSAWTKFWDAGEEVAKGTGVTDIKRMHFMMSLLLMTQHESVLRMAKMEDKNKNGLFGRFLITFYEKNAFDFASILGADYKDLLSDEGKQKMAPLIGALTERAMKLLMAAWVADEFPPLSVLSAYQEQTRDTAARRAEAAAAQRAEAAGEEGEEGEEAAQASEEDEEPTASQLSAAGADYSVLNYADINNGTGVQGVDRAPLSEEGQEEEGEDTVPPPSLTSSGRSSLGSSRRSSLGAADGAPPPQESMEMQRKRFATETSTMMPDVPGGAHALLVAALECYDNEYMRQSSGPDGPGKAGYVAAAGKGGTHMLRRCPTLARLRKGAELLSMLQGVRRMPIVDSDGGPLFLKKLIAAMQERKDLKLGRDYLAGDPNGAGLVATVDRASTYLAFITGQLLLKSSYAAVVAGKDVLPPVANVPSVVAVPTSAAEAGGQGSGGRTPGPATDMLGRARKIMVTDSFFVTPSELPKHCTLEQFREAAEHLESNGLALLFSEVIGYGPAQNMVTPLGHGTMIRTGCKVTFVVKMLSYVGCDESLARAHLSAAEASDYDALLHQSTGVARTAKEKMLRLLTYMASVAALAGRLDTLAEPGAIRSAALTAYQFSGGSLSALSTAAQKLTQRDLDGKKRRALLEAKAKNEALDRVLGDASELKKLHEATLQATRNACGSLPPHIPANPAHLATARRSHVSTSPAVPANSALMRPLSWPSSPRRSSSRPSTRAWSCSRTLRCPLSRRGPPRMIPLASGPRLLGTTTTTSRSSASACAARAGAVSALAGASSRRQPASSSGDRKLGGATPFWRGATALGGV